jgi:hypothetical protein
MASAVGSRPQTDRLDRVGRIVISWSARPASGSLVELATIAAIAVIVGYLLLVALWLRVDYYDSYLSLLNAQAITHGEGWLYSTLRPILYPVLLTPIFVVLERFHDSALAEFVAAHVLAVILFALFLFGCFKLFRLHLSRPWALGGVLLLSMNVLLLSQAPLAKEDIPGAFFTTAAFFFYLRARETGRFRYVPPAAVMIAGVMGTRYQLAPLPFTVILAYEVLTWRLSGWRARLPSLAIRVVSLFVLPIALFLLLPVVVYPLLHRAPLLAAPQQFIDDLLAVANGQAAYPRDPWIVNVRFLVESMSWPLLLCAAVGVVTGVRSKKPGTLFHLVWFVVFFGAMTYLLTHKEARYLTPAFPPVYFFATRGLKAIVSFLTTVPRLTILRDSRAALAIVLLLLLVPAGNAFAAAARFTDPVYDTNYEAQVARYASVLAGTQRLSWVGPEYTLHPRNYVFDRADPVTYIYHYYAFQMMFWTHQWVYPLHGYQIVTDPTSPAFVYAGIANVLRDGDVVVVNAASHGYATGDVPDSLPPLVVEQVHTQVFASSTVADAANWLFTSPTMPGVIGIQRQAPMYLVEGTGLPDGTYELYTPEITSGLWHSLALVTVRGGVFKTSVPGEHWPAGRPSGNLLILYYGAAFPFPSP